MEGRRTDREQPIRNGCVAMNVVGCKYAHIRLKLKLILDEKSCEVRPRKASKGYVNNDRTKTDTGRRVEYTKALGRILVKELCKMAPYVRNKGCLWRFTLPGVTVNRYQQLFIKNTGPCQLVRGCIRSDACPVPAS